MPSRPDREARIAIDNRRAEAALLHARGWRLEAIGRHLHADPDINSRALAIPEGYGSDRYKEGKPAAPTRRLTHDVSRDIRRATIDRMTRLDDNVDVLRAVRVGQYNDLLRPVLDQLATEPAVDDAEDYDRAWDRCYKLRDQALRILGRLDTLQGVARPVRTELTGAAGGPVQVEHVDVAELEALIAAAARATGTAAGAEAGEGTGGDEG